MAVKTAASKAGSGAPSMRVDPITVESMIESDAFC